MKQAKPDDVPTMWLHLKAPVEFFERLDRWREQQQAMRGMTIKPTRPASIRWIVYQYLLKQEERAKRPKRRGR